MKTAAPEKVVYSAVSRDGHEQRVATKRLRQFAVESYLEPRDFWVKEMDLPAGWHIVSFHGTREAAQRAADHYARESAVVPCEVVVPRRNKGVLL